MKKFEILEHKADLKIRAFAKTKEELFLNMLGAMAESQKPEIKKGEKIPWDDREVVREEFEKIKQK